MKVCALCARPRLLVALHGDAGGPDVCPDCSSELLSSARRAEREQRDFLSSLGGGLFGGGGSPGPAELDAELLTDVLSLTHPDRHPEERAKVATRVTAALTAMRPHAKRRPEPQPRDESAPVGHGGGGEPVTAYPCATCRHLRRVNLYCDPCRERWEADLEAVRERDRAYRRELRARRREARLAACECCAQYFKPARADARYCGNACRQRAYRQRAAPRQLEEGQEADGFSSLADRRARRRKRTEGVDSGREAA